ncbi:hypothetical protein [uncultured Roseovarius sp.]|uniref:hypothetical protein n=1 Tax=Roseovarius sp. TaxID=1486281 RepID=UPI0025F489E5|nr:hypothetical protein [uncultured Roseovarius sp.]
MSPEPPPVKLGIMRTLRRLAVVIVMVIALHEVFVRAEAWISTSQYSWAMPGLTLAVLFLYALMIAIPFVPGVEIGLSVLALSGPSVAPMVWLATTFGLSLAYMAGCKVPYRWLHRVFLDLHLTGACRLLQRFETLPPKGRVAFLQSQLPTRFGPYLLRFRYLGLGILINIPGNSVIGGGGGITLLAGVSGLFRMPATILTIALATAPVPMAIWLFGWEIPWG